MKAISSQTRVIGQTVIIDLDINDVTEQIDQKAFADIIEPKTTNSVIIDLSTIESITQAELTQIHKIVQLSQLMGKPCIVCGFSPLCAALVVTFSSDCTFDTELNVDYAIKKISNTT